MWPVTLHTVLSYVIAMKHIRHDTTSGPRGNGVARDRADMIPTKSKLKTAWTSTALVFIPHKVWR